MQTLVGGPEVFEPFMKAYIANFALKTVTTDEFKAFLLDYFDLSEALASLDWDTWLYKPGAIHAYTFASKPKCGPSVELVITITACKALTSSTCSRRNIITSRLLSACAHRTGQWPRWRHGRVGGAAMLALVASFARLRVLTSLIRSKSDSAAV